MLIAPPLSYDEIMKTVPYGSVTTSEHIRRLLAQRHGVYSTTAGIFINIVAAASDEREDDKTPYWRALKKAGELDLRYPGGGELSGRGKCLKLRVTLWCRKESVASLRVTRKS